MRIEIVHGIIADSYHILIVTFITSIVTITKEQAQKLSKEQNLIIKDY